MQEQQIGITNTEKLKHRIIEYQGKRYTLTQLADFAGINQTTLKERLNNGWSVEDAVKKPIRGRTKGWRMSAEMREREGE